MQSGSFFPTLAFHRFIFISTCLQPKFSSMSSSHLFSSIFSSTHLTSPHLNPQTLLSSANCSKLHPFDAARETSLRPDPSPRQDYGDLDARTTPSFSKIKEWGDPLRFHPGCRKGSQLHGSEQRREDGGRTTATPPTAALSLRRW